MKTMLALIAALALPGAAVADPGSRYARDMPQPAPATLTVMSYNVEGLPWPFARHRAAAAHRIAGELRGLRAAGAAPQVVAIQEGFRAADKRIGVRAGYAYAATGPDRGEAGGRHMDSGLAVFSDFPIVWVRQAAFPRHACAGFDCLANKGMLAVALQVPGRDAPVVLVDTHLNSDAASGVSQGRSLPAFERQVDALDGFVREVAPDAATAMILAGDYNIGLAVGRAGYVRDRLVDPAGLQIAAAEHGAPGDRHMIDGADHPGDLLPHARTLLMARGASPDAPAGRFGRADDGTMLSDHLGVAMRFAI